MKIHFRNLSTVKRWIKWNVLRLRSKFVYKEDRFRLPKKMTDSERTAIKIFLIVLNEPGSKLYYDLNTQECFLRSEDSTIFIFLEYLNIKIINSVYGYDVNISIQLQQYLIERFRREMAIRRQKFKQEALDRVEHSLEATLEKITKKC